MLLEQPSLAIPNYKKAFDLRSRVSERERLYIEGMYYLNVTGEMEKAVQVLREHVQAYPNDADAHGWLGETLNQLGQWDKSAVECRESLRLNPDEGDIASLLIGDDLLLNRLDEAKAVYEQGRARKLQNGFPDSIMYSLAFAEGDATGMQQYFDASMGKPGIEDILLIMRSDDESYCGRLGKAREFSQRAAESARKNGAKETTALWQAHAALREAEFGNAVEASRQAEAALSLTPGRDVRVLAAMALARAGNTTEVTKLADSLSQEFPLDTLMQRNVLPTIRAMLALSRGQGEQALKLLAETSEYELAVPQAFNTSQPAMYPIYVRGQAYLKAGQGQQAIAEFQQMIAFRWMEYPLRALARLQLGRAYAMQGDSAKAKAAYQDFLTLWKDADPDIPILKEAKAEYGKLQ
jgi:tetratricopeptide (TPR) repeat protein